MGNSPSNFDLKKVQRTEDEGAPLNSPSNSERDSHSPKPITTTAADSSVVIHNEHIRSNQFSDCWDIEEPHDNPYIECHAKRANTIYLSNSLDAISRKQKPFVSCFGTKIVSKGDYKRWQIKIVPHPEDKKTKKTAKVMIGVVDIDSIPVGERGQAVPYEFWMMPYFGYAVGGKGRKFESNSKKEKKGKYYNLKGFKIGDTITVELNLTQNPFLSHNELNFMTNNHVNGTAFKVEPERNYVLAVALTNDDYALQICD